MLSSYALLSVATALLAACNVVVASPQVFASTPTPTIPGHCSTTIDDFEHTTASVRTHECYTYTRIAPSSTCPMIKCAPRPTDVFCPQYIRVSSVTVPCSTDCCPTTPTSYVSTGRCPTCAPCVVPTQWITYTTGCPGTPTISTETIETPPWNTPDEE
ncbi:hypothetical protein GGS23DRAFT_33414 [Durotheca rogersii]|uniref:uncharacterized protein n=1 Tax=Durotheca rogersii TaxID=419775 RepID=UPI00221F17B2|nr:uncharacterized protein GGS23DRAFT_33414 [Durotheca rogersii]KAI5868488.1 hypothetical protein GGS23DRAFT_33414 [Durotheca rogersii]